LAVGRIGALQRVSRPATFASGDPRGALYALRLRIENVGERPASFEGAQLRVVSAGVVAAAAELLLELEHLGPGERSDGWLVFELSDGELPEGVELDDDGDARRVWQADVTELIEDRQVYAGSPATTATRAPQ
jgi:hypothetical protein